MFNVEFVGQALLSSFRDVCLTLCFNNVRCSSDEVHYYCIGSTTYLSLACVAHPFPTFSRRRVRFDVLC